MIDRYVHVNGLRLHVIEEPGGTPTLVFLPGLTVSGSIFDSVINAGLRGLFHTVAIDLRGRGLSEAPPAGLNPARPSANYTMDDHADDVLAVLDALAVDEPLLVGHSFGGMLALYLAAQAAERFHRLIVLDAAAVLASEETRALLGPTLSRLDQLKPSWEEYLAALKRQPYFDGWWHPSAEAYFRDDLHTNVDGSVRPRPTSAAIRAASEGMLEVDWNGVLARVHQPVLLLNATGPFGPPGAPAFLTPEGARATVAALERGRYAAVAGNHVTMVFGEFAPALARAIADFAAEEPSC